MNRITLKQLLVHLKSPIYPAYLHTSEPATNEVVSLIQAYYPIFSADDALKTNKCDMLFCRYIAPRYQNEICIITENDEITEDEVYMFFDRFINIFKRSYGEYERLIDAVDGYDVGEEHIDGLDLFNNIKTHSDSRFNDCPQTDSDSKINLDYATTYTVNESSVENDNAAKIAEVEQLIKDYYQKWSDEFKELFIYD